MELLPYFQALLLGIVEGVTEFLPISSTGHLILTIELLGFKGPEGAVFEVVIQLGAILAVCWYYRKKLIDTVRYFFTAPAKRRFAWLIGLAFIPSVVLGLLAHDIIKSVLFSPIVVAISLIVGGVAILIIERIKPETPKEDDVDTLSYRTALLIGFFQTLAMVPGVSRSGATIMGALMLGTSRKAATEFSFFLAIPTMLGATAYDLYKNYDTLTTDGMALIAVGFVTAFISGLFAIKWLLNFVMRHDFVGFAYYRIIIGGVMLTWLLAA